MLPHYQWQGRDDDLDHGDHDEDDEESQVIGGGGGDPVRAPFYGIPFPSKSRHFILLQVICRGKTAHFRLQLTTQEGKREQQDDHGGGDDMMMMILVMMMMVIFFFHNNDNNDENYCFQFELTTEAGRLGDWAKVTILPFFCLSVTDDEDFEYF